MAKCVSARVLFSSGNVHHMYTTVSDIKIDCVEMIVSLKFGCAQVIVLLCLYDASFILAMQHQSDVLVLI